MVLKLVVVLFILVSDGEGYKTDCVFHDYTGGPGQVIATFEPTLPGKISLEFGDDSLKIFSSIIGLVPEVGGALSTLYGVIGDLTDNTVDNMMALQKAINDLNDDIRKTVEDLKKYVDAKFNEYDYDKKSEALKGIYDQSGLCASFSRPENEEGCLKNLILAMVGKYSMFLPADPKYETFEQLLPMTRQFADLHVATLLDTLKVTKVDPDYKSALANFSVTVYNYFVHGINSIVDQHLRNTNEVSCEVINEKQFCIQICYTPPCPKCYCTHIGAYACEQEWDNGDGCRRQYPDPEDTGSDNNCFSAGWFWSSNAQRQIKDKLATYHTNLESSIRKYWSADVGKTMEHWKELGIKAGAIESSYLPYNTEPAFSKQVRSGYRKAVVTKYLAQLIHVIQNALITAISKPSGKNKHELFKL